MFETEGPQGNFIGTKGRQLVLEKNSIRILKTTRITISMMKSGGKKSYYDTNTTFFEDSITAYYPRYTANF